MSLLHVDSKKNIMAVVYEQHPIPALLSSRSMAADMPTTSLYTYTILLLLAGLIVFSSLQTPCSAATADGGDTLVAGQGLGVGDKLVSRNGKFALGFFQFQFQPGQGIISKSRSTHDTTTAASSPAWYLGIWFHKIPVFTVVWVANREKPISDLQLKRAQLQISSDGSLIIIILNNNTTSTGSIIWSTQIVANRSSTQTGVNTATILMNNGNLVVESPSSRVRIPLWQSFDYPTDVGLSGAKLVWTKVNGSRTLNRRFISKKSLVDAGLGSFYIELDTNGVIHLGRLNPPFVDYWSWSSEKFTDKLLTIVTAVLDMDPRTKGLFKLAYVKNSEEEYFTYTSLLDESASVFVSIDITGQVKINLWSQDTQSWQTINAEPSDVCSPYAECGPFTVCNGASNPFCYCMESFSPRSPRDWDLGDHTGGCVRNTTLDCTASYKNTSSTDVFHPIARVTLPYDPRSIQHATTQTKCAQRCLSDCSCTAYSYNNNSECSVWHGELFDVKQNDGVDNNSEQVVYLRIAAKDMQSRRTKGKRRPNIEAVIVAASIISFGILMSLLLFMIWRNRFKWLGGLLHRNQGNVDGLISFRYADLCHATKKFTDRLGGGSFGSVFKGVLGNQTTIAVKRLEGNHQGEKQFRAEVSSIGLIQHINLVKLIGFCCESDNRLLVYEHMPNGSLDSHLFKKNAPILNWSNRYQIAGGVARGLRYLHQSCHQCIIHCDIKPENILLGASFFPKIADFGLSVFVGRDFSRILTTSRGTRGYLAPEWMSEVHVTPKVDVYSFGMVLLEIISGRRNSQVYTSNNCHIAYFPVQAASKLHEGDVQSLVDPQLQGDFDLAEAERICKVACWCIQDNEGHRPTMGEVV